MLLSVVPLLPRTTHTAAGSHLQTVHDCRPHAIVAAVPAGLQSLMHITQMQAAATATTAAAVAQVGIEQAQLQHRVQ